MPKGGEGRDEISKDGVGLPPSKSHFSNPHFTLFHIYATLVFMNTKEKLAELEWILHRVRVSDGVRTEVDGYNRERVSERVYMLEQVINDCKDYTCADVHAWGCEEACKGVYGKIRDILRMRMVTEEGIDKAVKLKYLAAFEGFVDAAKVDLTSKGEKVQSVMFYLPDNGRDDAKALDD